MCRNGGATRRGLRCSACSRVMSYEVLGMSNEVLAARLTLNYSVSNRTRRPNARSCMSDEVLLMSHEVSEPACSPRQSWLCGVPSLYYYRLTHSPKSSAPGVASLRKTSIGNSLPKGSLECLKSHALIHVSSACKNENDFPADWQPGASVDWGGVPHIERQLP